jgi:hypothetical protein
MKSQGPLFIDTGDPVDQPFSVRRKLAISRIKPLPLSVVGGFDGRFLFPLFLGRLFFRRIYFRWFFCENRYWKEKESKEEGK